MIDRWLMPVLKVLAVVLLCGWCYSPATKGTWLWDDDQAVTQNPITQGPFSFRKIWVSPVGDAFEAMTAQGLHWLGYGPPPPPPAPCAFGETDYWPLTQTGFWMQWHLFGPDSAGYHVVNTALHAIGALMLWRLMTVMRLPGGWFAALLFAVHPLAVESVTWVSELKNVLSLPFMLLAAIHFVRADDRVTGADGATARLGWWVDYAISLVCFLMAMFAKTSVVMLPPTLLLYVWWKRNWIGLADLVRTAPYFLISLVYGLITIYFQHGRAIGAETILVGGFWSRLAMASLAVPFYLGKVFLPYGLMPIYPRWEIDVPKLWHFLPLPVFAGLAAWCWVNRQTWGRHVLFAIGFFVLMLLPILGFITISYMRITWAADHFIYLPMIGVIALISAALAGWFSRLPAGERPLLVAGCAAGLAVLTWISHGLATTWVNEDELWTHTLQHNENAWQAHNRLGAKKFARGHVDDIPIPNPTLLDPATQVKIKGSLHHFTRSTALRPDLGETHNNLGTALSAKGRLDEAIEQFKEAVRVTPHVPMIHVNLANALAAGGRFAEAEEHYLRLIQGAEAGHADAVERSGNANLPIDPSIAALINNYGVSLFKQGKKDEAIAAFKRALAINPNLKDARESLTLATGDKPPPAPAAGGPAAPPPGGVPPLPMAVPQSPTLGPTSP